MSATSNLKLELREPSIAHMNTPTLQSAQCIAMRRLGWHNVARRTFWRVSCQSIHVSSPDYYQIIPLTKSSKFLRCSSTLDRKQPSLLKITHHTNESLIGDIKVISLNSPHNSNALSKKLVSELLAEFKALKEAGDGSHGGTRVLILASELDKVFCAGADLKERQAMSDDE